MPVAVIDACVAMTWVMPDEGGAAANVLRAHQERRVGLLAPTIWEYEIANSLKTAVIRGRIESDFGRECLTDLLGMGIHFIAFSDLAPRSWELALTRDLSVYDAAYIALAEERECELYTCDAKLAHAAENLVTVQLLHN